MTLTLERADGGVLAHGIVAISADDARSAGVRTGPRGEVHLPGLEPGPRTLVIEADGAKGELTLDVPASGAVRRTIQLQ